MTIDERIEKLTERHEALSQTVELLVRAQLEFEKRQEQRWERRGQRWEEDQRRFTGINKLVQQNELRMAQVLDTINRAREHRGGPRLPARRS